MKTACILCCAALVAGAESEVRPLNQKLVPRTLPAPAPAVAAPAAAMPAPVASAASVVPATPTSDQTAIARHLAALDAKIAQLERRTVQGSGAFRRGTSFLVDGGGSESVLERLRRLEQELAQARGELSVRDSSLAELRARADSERERAGGLAEKADSLAHVRDSLVAAQQTLGERQAIIDRLTQRLAEADLARLQGERAYFLLAAALLKLTPGQTQELMELQEQVRQQAKVLQPAETARPGNATRGVP